MLEFSMFITQRLLELLLPEFTMLPLLFAIEAFLEEDTMVVEQLYTPHTFMAANTKHKSSD